MIVYDTNGEAAKLCILKKEMKMRVTHIYQDDIRVSERCRSVFFKLRELPILHTRSQQR